MCTRIMFQEASASCSIIQMLPPCLLIPPLGQLSPRRRDQNSTMPVRQPPFSVLEPCGKGRPSVAEPMRHFWIATVQSLACLQSKTQRLHRVSVSKLSGDLEGINRECYFFQTIRHFVEQMSRTLVVRFVGKLAVYLLSHDAMVLYIWSLLLLLRFGS